MARKFDPVGSVEIAEILGVSRQRVFAMADSRRLNFPQPAAELAMGKLWDRAEVEAWIRKNR